MNNTNDEIIAKLVQQIADLSPQDIWNLARSLNQNYEASANLLQSDLSFTIQED